MNTFTKTLAAAAAVLAVGATQAATLYSNPASTGAQDAPGSLSYSFSGAGYTSGLLGFTLEGYLSLDGDGNCCTDVFHLGINGTEVFTGAFGLGGGGNNVVYLDSNGATLDTSNTSPFVTWAGGSVTFWVPFALVAGTNTLDFSYSGGGQGLGDEGWGLNSVTVTAVPEPGAYAMFLAGLGAMGLVGRRRRQRGD